MHKMTPEKLDGLLQRLHGGGCPVQRKHGYEVPPAGLTIEMIPGGGLNTVFDLDHERTGYLLQPLLRNDLDRPIDIAGYQIQTPWGIPRLSLVPPWKKSAPKDSPYIYPGGTLYFDGEIVINNMFARKMSRLNPHEEVEGLLLAVDEAPIPDEYSHLARIMVTLNLFDSRRNRFPAPFMLQVDRSALRARERAKERTASSQPARTRMRETV